MTDLTREEQAIALGYGSAQEMDDYQRWSERHPYAEAATKVVQATRDAEAKVVGTPCPNCSKPLGVIGGWRPHPPPDLGGEAYVLAKCVACGHSCHPSQL